MNGFPLVMVYSWSVISLIFAMVSLSSDKALEPLPAFLGYLSIGLLGVFVGTALKFQQGRIARLERALSQQN